MGLDLPDHPGSIVRLLPRPREARGHLPGVQGPAAPDRPPEVQGPAHPAPVLPDPAASAVPPPGVEVSAVLPVAEALAEAALAAPGAAQAVPGEAASAEAALAADADNSPACSYINKQRKAPDDSGAFLYERTVSSPYGCPKRTLRSGPAFSPSPQHSGRSL